MISQKIEEHHLEKGDYCYDMAKIMAKRTNFTGSFPFSLKSLKLSTGWDVKMCVFPLRVILRVFGIFNGKKLHKPF